MSLNEIVSDNPFVKEQEEAYLKEDDVSDPLLGDSVIGCLLFDVLNVFAA